MSRIPTNPVKALHVSDFEDQYWVAVRQLKQQGARRALYAAPVTGPLSFFCPYFHILVI